MIFDRLFKKGYVEEAELDFNAADDATLIQQSVNFIIIKSAWNEYAILKQRDPQYDPDITNRPPIWEGLTRVVDYNGDFTQFTAEEYPLLYALKRGFLFYADVLHIFIDHHDDIEAGEEIFAKYPELHAEMPENYDKPEHVLEVMIEMIRDYQWQVEHFYLKHKTAIDAQLAKITPVVK